MWILQCQNNLSEDSKTFNFHVKGKDFTIGRKSCNVELETKSISRSHCSIKFLSNSSFCITDHSKFGTFVGENCERIVGCYSAVDEEYILIKFGPQSMPFSLRNLDLKVCFSSISLHQKQQLGKFCDTLWIEKSFVWSKSCTHLVMDSISLSEKLLLCLLDAKPVLSAKWIEEIWGECQESAVSTFNVNLWLEKIDSYVPELDEVMKKSALLKKSLFLPDKKRISFFKNLLFLFFERSTKEKMQRIIEYAHGKCLHISEIHRVSKDDFADFQYVIIKGKISEPSVNIEHFNLNDCKVNIEQDIGMSIVLKNCNILNKHSFSASLAKVSVEEFKENINNYSPLSLTESINQIQCKASCNESFDHSLLDLISNTNRTEILQQSSHYNDLALSHIYDPIQRLDANVINENSIDRNILSSTVESIPSNEFSISNSPSSIPSNEFSISNSPSLLLRNTKRFKKNKVIEKSNPIQVGISPNKQHIHNPVLEEWLMEPQK